MQEFRLRISTLSRLLSDREAIFLTNPITIRYLSGISFYEDAYILILKNRVYIISDSRYREELKTVVEPFIPVEIKSRLFSTVVDLLPSSVNNILVEDCFPIGWKLDLEKISNCNITCNHCLTNSIKKMRSIKTDNEIYIIKQNFKLHRKLFSIWKEMIYGFSEYEASVLWRCLVLEHGCEGVSFSPIVAVGASASKPHYASGKKRITGKLPVLFDSGISRKGYKTDLTRMLFTAKMSRRFRYYLALVEEAQQRAFSFIRPGLLAADLDSVVRDFFRSKGVDEFFVHSLGHGLGLEIHEAPIISCKSKDILEPGMIFTIEPGLYIPGRIGVRLEDVVMVTEKGFEIISK